MYGQADMAELADAPDLGSGGTPVQVQVLLSAFDKTPESLYLSGSRGFCISERGQKGANHKIFIPAMIWFSFSFRRSVM